MQLSMDLSIKGRTQHIPITIKEAIEWSRGESGEWQLPNSGDGCMRYGLCESAEDPPTAPTTHLAPSAAEVV